jgi:hypothetical protein
VATARRGRRGPGSRNPALGNVPLQVGVGRKADGVLHASLLQGFVDLRLGEGGVGPKDHFFALLLLALDLREQSFVPVLSAVDVARAKLGGQAVALAIEQQQRVIAGGLEVSIVGSVFLLAVDGDLGAIHV